MEIYILWLNCKVVNKFDILIIFLYSTLSSQIIAEDDITETEPIPEQATESQYDNEETSTNALKDETMNIFPEKKGESSLETGKIYYFTEIC